ncbi:hypothetical protein C8J56DRAFT_927044 [Mycena floridula]|nr:hypothetical protein C8J56DRAFT_927044 [Mycena floridula]
MRAPQLSMVNHDMDSPPSYDSAISSSKPGPPNDTKAPLVLNSQPYVAPGPSYTTTTQTVYNYVNPETQEHIASLLPPDHPAMICLQNGHVPTTKFGILGILAAVFWFPLGVGLCLLDSHSRCKRCGDRL